MNATFRNPYRAFYENPSKEVAGARASQAEGQ